MSPPTFKHRHRRRGGPPAWGRGDSSVLVPAPCSVLLARAQEPPPAPCAPYPASPPFPWAMPKPLSALGIKRAGWKCSCECLGHGAAPHRGALEPVGTPVSQIPMSLTLGVLVPPCPAVSGSQYPCVCWVLGQCITFVACRVFSGGWQVVVSLRNRFLHHRGRAGLLPPGTVLLNGVASG